MSKYSHIIWDWNGTLFNDVAWSIEVFNTMLKKRGIRTLKNVSDYHNVFCFPVIQYYKNVGLDLDSETFEDLAAEFILLYHSGNSGNCKLFPNAETVLNAIYESGITQVVLSASEKGNLLSQIKEFDIANYFDEILGLSDIFAKSKVDIGLDYIKRKNVKDAILIGDTTHDYEVANALGIDCALIPNGHQSKNALLSCNVPVLDDISEFIEYVKRM